MKKDFISIEDISRKEMEELFELASEMARGNYTRWAEGKDLAKLFYEPSDRTRSSFERAMHKFGGGVIGFDSAESSSAMKGERLEDTARIYSDMAEIIVVRHPQVGSAEIMAEYASVPVINAGDGINEHPTQALLDLYTIQKRKGQIDGLKIGICGDLKNGRTVHSLMLGLNKFEDIELYIWAPEGLWLEENFEKKIKHEIFHTPSFYIFSRNFGFDVLYVTRIQQERFKDPEDYEAVKGTYCINKEVMSFQREDMLLMHPLPRVSEIDPDIDKDPRAIYFKQAAHGVPVRMALIATLLK